MDGSLRRAASRGQTHADDFATFESLLTVWTTLNEQMRQFLSTLTEADAQHGRIRDRRDTPSLPVGVLQHAAIHSIHHRGQVALLLRAIGVAPGNFDVLFYQHEMQHVAS